MKAIETKYKGYRFRSRLEARWAVFFDALGLRWEYEPEGFDLGAAGWYLPDFRITGYGGEFYWVEVKGGIDEGRHMSDEDAFKVLSFGRALGKDCNIWILGGIPKFAHEYCFPVVKPHKCSYEGSHIKLEMSIFWENPGFLFAEPINLGQLWRWVDVEDPRLLGGLFVGAIFSHHSIREACKDSSIQCINIPSNKGTIGYQDACNAARSARFEHGERG